MASEAGPTISAIQAAEGKSTMGPIDISGKTHADAKVLLANPIAQATTQAAASKQETLKAMTIELNAELGT